MTTMHFQIAQTGLFLGTFFGIKGVLGSNLASMRNYPWGRKVGQIRRQGYMLRYVVMGGVFGPQLYHRTSYRLNIYHIVGRKVFSEINNKSVW